MRIRLAVCAALSLLPAAADVKVRSTLSTAAGASETVVYAKPTRQRIEYGADAILLQQCDRKRTLQLDPKSQSFFLIPPAAAATQPAQKGGRVSVSTTYIHTGESKPWRQFTARRILTKVEMTPAPGACARQPSTIETDGWYVDLPAAALACTVPAATPPSSCSDEVTHTVSGDPQLGFPVSYSITTVSAGVSDTVRMEVTELDANSPLPDALFDVPSSYRDAAGKPAGVTRIAVAFPGDKTGLSGGVLPNQIFKALQQPGLEPLAIAHSSPAEVETSAKQVSADYILYAELASLQPAAPAAAKGGKGFGKFVGKAAGLLNQKEAWEARIDFRLVQPGAPTPLAAGSATGKTGADSFNVKGALNLAANVGMMMAMSGGPIGLMMGRGNFLSTMMQMNQLSAAGAMGPGGGLMGPAFGPLAGLNMMTSQNNLFQMSGGFSDIDPTTAMSPMPQGMSPMPAALGGQPGLPATPNSGSSSQDRQKALQLAVADLARAVAEKLKPPQP